MTGESSRPAALARERTRILKEYARREREIDPDLYAAWDPAAQFLVHDRKRLAAELLHRAGLFPGAASRCLEIGFGRGGWLVDLVGWGVPASRLFGVEIDPWRASAARSRLPAAHLVLADGGQLPWPGGRFQLVVMSTVMTSVLDPTVRRRIAAETERVLAPGGALLWYDFAVDNPRNDNVRGVGRRELGDLFPGLGGSVRSVTLAPPIARLVAPRSRWLTELLASLPFLRTHLLAILVKPRSES